MGRNYLPALRTQLGRPVTGSVDCGPRSWQMAIDKATRGQRVIGIDRLRQAGGVPGAQPTSIYDADRAFGALGIPYWTRVRAPWEEVFTALREGHGVHLCIAYGVFTDLTPRRSGSPTFRGGHSILLADVRRIKKHPARYAILDYDPLYDGRRDGIPSVPRWVAMWKLRRAAMAFAGQVGRFYGGIIPSVTGGPGVPEPDEPDFPSQPDDEPDEGTPFPLVSGDDLDPSSLPDDLDEDLEEEDVEPIDMGGQP